MSPCFEGVSVMVSQWVDKDSKLGRIYFGLPAAQKYVTESPFRLYLKVWGHSSANFEGPGLGSSRASLGASTTKPRLLSGMGEFRLCVVVYNCGSLDLSTSVACQGLGTVRP